MELLTKDLILRTVTEGDLHEIARMWNFWQGGVTLEQAHGVLAYMTHNHVRNESGQFYHLCLSVCRAEKPGEILGWCGLDGKENPERPEIFVLLQESARNRGYGTQCVKALLACAFEELGLHRVHGGCAKENLASAKMMEKAGMVQYCKEENGDPLFMACREENT